MFERFTDRARRVLVLAQEEARRLNHSFIGTEHVMLGLLGEEEGIAARALAGLGVTLDAAREKVRETVGSGSGPPATSPPFTPRAKKVLELSLREALQLGHGHIGTEHLLLGLVQEGHGVGFQVLVTLGAKGQDIRDTVGALLPTASGPTVAAAPLCRRCGAPLEGHLGFRQLTARTAPGDPNGEMTVLAYYCTRCGGAFGLHEIERPPAKE